MDVFDMGQRVMAREHRLIKRIECLSEYQARMALIIIAKGICMEIALSMAEEGFKVERSYRCPALRDKK